MLPEMDAIKLLNFSIRLIILLFTRTLHITYNVVNFQTFSFEKKLFSTKILFQDVYEIKVFKFFWPNFKNLFTVFGLFIENLSRYLRGSI